MLSHFSYAISVFLSSGIWKMKHLAHSGTSIYLIHLSDPDTEQVDLSPTTHPTSQLSYAPCQSSHFRLPVETETSHGTRVVPESNPVGQHTKHNRELQEATRAAICRGTQATGFQTPWEANVFDALTPSYTCSTPAVHLQSMRFWDHARPPGARSVVR